MSGLTQPRLQLRFRTSPSSIATTIILALVATGCATSEWAESKNLSIGYDQFESGASLMLVNRSHETYHDLYSKQRPTSNIKLIEDEDMKTLFDRFEAAGFFTWATPAQPLSPEDQRALSGRLTVTFDGDSYALVLYPRGNPVDKLNAFRVMVEDFRAAYDTAFALQAVENERGAQIFSDEQERLNRQGDPKRSKP